MNQCHMMVARVEIELNIECVNNAFNALSADQSGLTYGQPTIQSVGGCTNRGSITTVMLARCLAKHYMLLRLRQGTNIEKKNM
jgi:hypothetical protein